MHHWKNNPNKTIFDDGICVSINQNLNKTQLRTYVTEYGRHPIKPFKKLKSIRQKLSLPSCYRNLMGL